MNDEWRMLQENYFMKIYVLNVEKLNQDEIFQKAYEFLEESRKKRVDKCKRRPDQNRSLGAGLLLAYGLWDALKIPWSELKEQCGMNFGKYGKPYFEKWQGISFNLSHSGSYAACVLSHGGTPCDRYGENEVGIDIQKVCSCNLKVADRVFSKKDQERLEEACRKDKGLGDLLFSRLWAEKESRGKLLGTGIFLPEADGGEIYQKDYAVGNEYWLSVAAKRDGFPEEICERTVDEVLSVLER